MPPAIVAGHGEIRITAHRNPEFIECMRPAAAACAIHGCEDFVFVCQHQASGLRGSLKRRRPGPGRSAQELAVRGVTEIESVMPPFPCQQKRSRSHGLRFQGFHRRMWRAFGGNNGSHRGLKRHDDDNAQFAGLSPDLQLPAIMARNLSRHTRHKFRRAALRRCRRQSVRPETLSAPAMLIFAPCNSSSIGSRTGHGSVPALHWSGSPGTGETTICFA